MAEIADIPRFYMTNMVQLSSPTNPKKRGDSIMSQNILPFKYEPEKKEKKLTALCGLLLYLGLFKALRLPQIINKILKIKTDKQGYKDDQIILPLILLNLAGGESVSDIKLFALFYA